MFPLDIMSARSGIGNPKLGAPISAARLWDDEMDMVIKAVNMFIMLVIMKTRAYFAAH
jgi:hypothetical protein